MTGHQALPGVQAPRLVGRRCCGFHLHSRPEPTTPPDGLFQPEHNQSPRPPTLETSLWSQPDSWGLARALARLCTGADTTARQASLLPVHSHHLLPPHGARHAPSLRICPRLQECPLLRISSSASCGPSAYMTCFMSSSRLRLRTGTPCPRAGFRLPRSLRLRQLRAERSREGQGGAPAATSARTGAR